MSALIPRGDLVQATTDGPDAERIERFQALEPGTYWRVKKTYTYKETSWPSREVVLPKDLVLLLLDVKSVEDRVHTIALKYHPLEGDGTHDLLVEDFLSHFDLAMDGEEVRAREMQQLQKEIADLQAEMISAQSNPALLAPVVESELKKWEKDAAKAQAKDRAKAPQAESSQASALPALMPAGRLRTDLSSALENRVSKTDVAALHHAAQREAQIAQIKAGWLTEKTDAIGSKLSQLTPFFSEKSAVALARTQGVRKYAEEIMKGIESLDLYTGKGVDVETLAEGEEAESDEPLTILQRKLFADEELAAYADVDEKFDFDHMKDFDKALATNKAFRDQLMPFPRCVVSVAVRRDAVDYKDGWLNYTRNQVNKRVFLLVRNGDMVRRVYSSAPSHEFAERLFPTAAENKGHFEGVDGREISYRDVQYTKRLEGFELAALHYKRFLILLCGLDHRLGLFGRFYEGEESLSFISQDFQERFMRFVADDDPSLLLGDGRTPVREWISTQNERLRSGSRVLCYYKDLLSPKTAPACQKTRSGRKYDYVDTLAEPTAKWGFHVAYRDGNEICIDVPVKRQYKESGFNARVSLTKAERAGNGQFPFLCLDAVHPDEISAYVHERASRIRHVTFMRLFKAAAQVLTADRLAEREARTWIRESIVTAKLATPEAAGNVIDEAVIAWRAANRGAPLPGAQDKKALEGVLNYIHSTQVRTVEFLTSAEAFVQDKGLTPLRLAITGKDRLALYAEVNPSERDERLCTWRWVTRISLKATGGKLVETSRRMTWLTTNLDASEKVLREWPALATWINEKPQPFRHQDLTAILDAVGSHLESGITLATAPEIPQDVFDELLQAVRRRQRDEPGNQVGQADLSIPIGGFVTHYHGAPTPCTLAVVMRAGAFLWSKATPAQRPGIEEGFSSIYCNKDSGRAELRRELQPRLVAIVGPATGLIMDRQAKTFAPSITQMGWEAEQKLTISERIAHWKKMLEAKSFTDLGLIRFWLHEQALNEGECIIDAGLTQKESRRKSKPR